MKTWDEIFKAVNVTYEKTKQVDETAKIVGVSRWEVLEALGFSDEWAFVFDDDQNFSQVPAYKIGVSVVFVSTYVAVFAKEYMNLLGSLSQIKVLPRGSRHTS